MAGMKSTVMKMDWKSEAKQRLKNYGSWQRALQTIPMELEQTRLAVSSVDRALQKLTREQRQLLQGFYMDPQWGNANTLLMELGISKSTLYRKKDEALKCFAQAFYGAD